jgi:hypothetical protein
VCVCVLFGHRLQGKEESHKQRPGHHGHDEGMERRGAVLGEESREVLLVLLRQNLKKKEEIRGTMSVRACA